MKKLLIIFSLSLMMTSHNVLANIDACENIGDFSDTVMRSRQLGMPLINILKIAESYEGYIMSDIVRDAWKYSIESSVKKKKLTTEKFKNKQLVTCYRVLTK